MHIDSGLMNAPKMIYINNVAVLFLVETGSELSIIKQHVTQKRKEVDIKSIDCID